MLPRRSLSSSSVMESTEAPQNPPPVPAVLPPAPCSACAACATKFVSESRRKSDIGFSGHNIDEDFVSPNGALNESSKTTL